MPPRAANLAQSIRGPITDLTATLLSAWTMYGAGDAKGAVAAIDKLTGPDWYAIFKELHAGMIYDLAGNKKEAGKRFEHAYKLDPSGAAGGRGLWQLAVAQRVAQGSARRLRGLRQGAAAPPAGGRGDGQAQGRREAAAAGATAQAGAAEALYGLGASLGRRGGEDLGLVYLQLSLYLAPNHPLALLSLADLYESLKKPELAIKVYERVPASSPLHRNAAIQMAANLDALERADEAEKHLDALIKQHPDDLEAIMALGNVLRGHKKFAECADVYSKGVATIAQAGKSELGDLLFPRHLLRALASSGRRRKPISRRRSSCSPSSRTCSIISAIPGSIRASTWTRAWT